MEIFKIFGISKLSKLSAENYSHRFVALTRKTIYPIARKTSVQSRMRTSVLDQRRAASGMVTCCRSVSSGLLIQSRPALSRLFDKPITRPGNRAVHLLGCGIVLGVKADEQLEGSMIDRGG